MKRRDFFKTTSLAGGGLLISTFIPLSCNVPAEQSVSWEPNFFLRIDTNNKITFICSRTELGQGTSTGLAMIVADELLIDLENLSIEFADGAMEKYGNLQDTGGSNGIRLLWNPLREAMAITREIFIMAAAQIWDMEPKDCYSEQGLVYDKSNDREATYASLIYLAKTLPAPFEVKLRNSSEYKYIGKPVIGKRIKTIVQGKYPYGIDVKLPNLVYAAIERCPVWGGKLVSFDDKKAKEFPGVIDVMEIPSTEIQTSDFKGGVRPGVAILANNTWAALEAKKLLNINWNLGPFAEKSDSDVEKELKEQLKKPKTIHSDFNNASELLKVSNKKIVATYVSSYQANACMEPLNATAYHRGNIIEIWAGSQGPAMFRERIHELTGLPEAAIISHNLPSGGGFGRRFHSDYVEEAVLISQKIRLPVKVTWSREDTITTSKYHPFCVDSWEASFDKNNKIMAIGYQGTVSNTNGYRPYPYSLPMAHFNRLTEKSGRLLPRSSWRSVFAHPWILSLECFIDELAATQKMDALSFRFELLKEAKVVEQLMEVWVGDNLYPKKLLRTLESVQKKSNWGNSRDGIFQGVACASYNTSYCSLVFDISLVDDMIKVHKATAVVDCGLIINPSKVKAQIEGSIIWGLTAALKSGITVKKGRVVQSNFHDYNLLRIDETPTIQVCLLESSDAPSGAGEVAVPVVAPALLNAIYAATGKRIRKLPVQNHAF